LPEQRDIPEPAVNVADDFVRVDLARRSTVKIGNSGRRYFQTFQLLLSNCVGNRTHIAVNVSLGNVLIIALGSFFKIRPPDLGEIKLTRV
jgi:hypothetical protein